MASLKSELLSPDARLNDCAVRDQSHVLTGNQGDFVKRIQTALFILDGAEIDASDLDAGIYGRSTAAAVLSYKTNRGIIAKGRQTAADDIVGKMTIASLDREMLEVEGRPSGPVCVKAMRPIAGRGF
ncbi:MAG: hypothetical protein H7Y08_03780 [Rhizobiaceae bacterium]|nr:hypothetical protein [Rhizobiaceae bacterium]